jgi:GABA(A) receptor-associated protein
MENEVKVENKFKPMKQGSFKKMHTQEKRYNETKVLLEKYPNKIPCIIEVNDTLLSLPVFHTKWLIPEDITVIGLIMKIRNKYTNIIKASDGLFLFIGTSVCRPDEMIKNIYNKYKDEDNFLYMTLSKENVFG